MFIISYHTFVEIISSLFLEYNKPITSLPKLFLIKKIDIKIMLSKDFIYDS